MMYVGHCRAWCWPSGSWCRKALWSCFFLWRRCYHSLPDMLLWCTMWVPFISMTLILSHQFSACSLPRDISHEPRPPRPMAFSSKNPLPVPATDLQVRSTFLNTWNVAFKAVNKFFGRQPPVLSRGKSLVCSDCVHADLLNIWINSPATDKHNWNICRIEGDHRRQLEPFKWVVKLHVSFIYVDLLRTLVE